MMLCSHAVDALQTFTEACEKGLMATKERGWKEEDAGEARSYGRRSCGKGGRRKIKLVIQIDANAYLCLLFSIQHGTISLKTRTSVFPS